ncbi:MAG: hypothetical protein IT374_03260 [Polyangiaceae bacterium]|nr:hypothetical protein [Polyangiaceae bacterium]
MNTSNDVDVLRKELTERDALIAVLRSTIASFEAQIAALEGTLLPLLQYANDVELYKRKLFGTKSERSGSELHSWSLPIPAPRACRPVSKDTVPTGAGAP